MKSLLLQATMMVGLVGGLQALTISSANADLVKPQSETIPFVEDNWVFIGGAAAVEHEGQNALKLGIAPEGAPFGFGTAMLKRAPFTNGIIEYDIFVGETRTFAGLSFRALDAGNFENFYLRAHQSGNPDANQYMPNYNGIQSWQLYYGEQYSAPTVYSFNEWMHVKLAVSGNLADIYINDMSAPAFSVELKRDEQTGGIGLWAFNMTGPAWIANFAVTPMDSVKLVGTAVPEAAANEGTIMTWQVSNSFDKKTLDGTANLSPSDVSALSFTNLKAGKDGMTNLAKLQGVSEGSDTVFAKVLINSDQDQTKKFNFGFSDQAIVYLNGQPLFAGGDGERTRDYRFLGTVGFYDTVYLPLKKGENELMIAVSESVALTNGWAVQGRFEDISGLNF